MIRHTLRKAAFVIWIGGVLLVSSGVRNQAETIVVPSGLADVEGIWSGYTVGYSGTFNQNQRLQEVYAASEFPANPIKITEIRFRRDASQGPVSTSITRLQVNVSTTKKMPNALSMTFAENVGTNDTAVFDGPLNIISQAAPVAGHPYPFDIVVPFNVPFTYDPAGGSLLLDIRCYSGSTLTWIDMSDKGTSTESRVFELDAFASRANPAGVGPGADVIQLTYSPVGGQPPVAGTAVVPSGLADIDGTWPGYTVGYSSTLGDDIHLQEVYAAAQFPPQPMTITEIRFRRDATQGPVSASITRLQMILSTTKRVPNALSLVYAENLGTNSTVVFDGPLTISSQAAPVAGHPYPFDIVVPLSSPFTYDPAMGNLLVDIRNYSGSALDSVDMGDKGTGTESRVFAFDADATIADPRGVGPGADVIQLTYLTGGGELQPSGLLEILPDSRTFTNSIYVLMATTNSFGVIRYTLDNSVPGGSAPAYVKPVRLTNTTVVSARLFFNEFPISDVASATFTAGSAPPEVQFIPDAPLFTNSVSVELKARIGFGTIRFTADGAEPGLTSPIYSEPIKLNSMTTVKARVFLQSDPISDVVSMTFARVYALNDGIPAAWREQYFGAGYLTDPRVAFDADPDGDGATNWQEYVAGTDPTNPQSVLKATIKAVPLISWESISNKVYRVMRKDTVNSTNAAIVLDNFRATNALSSFIDTEVPDATSFYSVEPLLP